MSGPFYTAIPASPVLDPDSATKSSALAGINHYATMGWPTATFALPTDPSYSIVYDQDPEAQPGQDYNWALGNRAHTAEEVEPVRLPDPPNFYTQPGSYADGAAWDGWGCVIDLARGIGWAGWRMVKVGSDWQATTSHSFAVPGTVAAVTNGLGRGDGLPVITGNITVQEAAAAAADATDTYVIPHALAAAGPMSMVDTVFRAPATKTDGLVAPTTSTISEGSRFYLPPSATTASTNRLIKAIVRTLKTYGMYIVDRNGSSAMVLNFERFDPANPTDMVQPDTGAPSTLADPTSIAGAYFRAGFTYDYFNLSAIPWSSLQLLKQWDGGGAAGPTTITRPIAATTDDGTASSGGLSTAEPILGTNYGDTAARSFFRFTGVSVPAGKTISSATLILTKAWADTGTLSGAIKGHNVDNSPAFTTAASVLTAALTTASSATITSTQAEWTAAGTVSVDVTSVVAAVVGRAGWASGNALSLIGVDVASTGNGYFEVADQSASLSITYA